MVSFPTVLLVSVALCLHLPGSTAHGHPAMAALQDVAPSLEAVDAGARSIRAMVDEEGGASSAARSQLAVLTADLPAADRMDERWEGPLEALVELAAELELWNQRRALCERVVSLKERRLEEASSELLDATRDLAVSLKKTGDLKAALRLEERVHELRERHHPEDIESLLVIKQNLGVTCARLGDVERARGLFEYIHDQRLEAGDPEDPKLLGAKLNLAVMRRAEGDLRGALELEEYVYEVRERTLPEDHIDLLRVRLNLGNSRFRLGDVEGALELYELAFASAARSLPEDHPDRLKVTMNLAGALDALGDSRRAVTMHEAVVEAYVRLLPADHPELLRAQSNLGAAREGIGDFEGALVLIEEVNAGFGALLPPDHLEVVRSKHNLAALRDMLGDHEGAFVLMDEVHDHFERALPPGSVELMRCKQNLAVMCKAVGRLDRAVDLVEEVVRVRRDTLHQDHRDLLAIESNLATTLSDLGDWEGALRLFTSVLERRRKNLPTDHPILLHAEQNVGSTLQNMGRPEAALEAFEAVVAAREDSLDEGHPELLLARMNLASTLVELGRDDEALAMARAVLEGQLARATRLHSESRRAARSIIVDELERLSKVLYVNESAEPSGQLVAEIFRVVEILRGISTASTRFALALASSEELSASGERLSDLRSELHDLSLTPPEEPEGLDSWNKQLASLLDQRDVLERELRRRLSESGLRMPTPSVAEIADRLPQGAVLLSFLRYERVQPFDRDLGGYPARVDSMMVFVVTRDGPVRAVQLGPAAGLAGLVERWRRSLGASGEDRGRGIRVGADDAAEAALGAALFDGLLAPCLAVVEARPSRIVVILDDFLHLLPLDALPFEGGRLGEHAPVQVETSVGRLVEPPPAVSGEGTLVCVGGVDFGAEVTLHSTSALGDAFPPGMRSGAPGSFSTLPETLAEVDALARMYSRSTGGEPYVLSGAEATKRALSDTASRARFLHVATHGWFASERFASMLDEDPALDPFGREQLLARDLVRGFAPETLCGLALAGANQGADELGRVHGILTAEELVALDLAQCELAVLSACETNVGLRRAGQGIYSLQGALHTAGVRTAVTSLWRVDDLATRRLMELFYAGVWEEGLRKDEALWAAKTALRGAGHPVQDWAGWVLTGDPR